MRLLDLLRYNPQYKQSSHSNTKISIKLDKKNNAKDRIFCLEILRVS